MYADAVARITRSIFPVFVLPPEHTGIPMGVRGTGFFIDSRGHFVTADHVMSGDGAGATGYYYGQIPDAVVRPALEIECVTRDPEHDLFLGRIARHYLEPVQLCDEAVRPGDSVCLSGYPMAVLAASPQGGVIGNIRRYWQPTFVIDATEALVNNRTYHGYIVQHPCLQGMSGGPVFDVDGRVRGIAVATFTRTIPEPGGSPTVVANAIVIDVEHIQRFLDSSKPNAVNRPPD